MSASELSYEMLRLMQEQQRKEAAKFAASFLPILHAKLKRFEEVIQTLEMAGLELNEEERRILATMKLAIEKFKLGRNECIAEIETKPLDTPITLLLRDIYFLMGATVGADYLTKNRIHGCLLRFANSNDEIIKRAAHYAIEEIKW